MPVLDIKTRASKFIIGLDGKQAGQIARAILALAVDPTPRDSEELAGFAPLRRKDVGEYRVVYWIDSDTDTVRIPLISKRNGDEVYQELRRLFQGKTPSLSGLADRFR
jgi:mRNA interferase RelE/StbE